MCPNDGFSVCILFPLECALWLLSPRTRYTLCDGRRITDFPFQLFSVLWPPNVTRKQMKNAAMCECAPCRARVSSQKVYYLDSCLQTSTPVRRNSMEVIILNYSARWNETKAAWFSDLWHSSTPLCIAPYFFSLFTFHQRNQQSRFSAAYFPRRPLESICVGISYVFTCNWKWNKNYILIRVRRSAFAVRRLRWTDTSICGCDTFFLRIYDAWNDVCSCCLLAKMAVVLSSFPVFRAITVHISCQRIGYSCTRIHS